MSTHTTQAEQGLHWPDNIVADRHEVSGKWVMWYLTGEQAEACNRALSPHTAARGTETLVDRIAELEEALAPFAALVESINRWRHDDGSTCMHQLRAIDIRKAAKLLGKPHD